MSRHAAAVLLAIGFSIVGVTGDYFLKLASGAESPPRSRWFLIGFAVDASTAFGWVFVMRHLKLATVGVVYLVSMIVILTVIGTLFFGESLSKRDCSASDGDPVGVSADPLRLTESCAA